MRVNIDGGGAVVMPRCEWEALYNDQLVADGPAAAAAIRLAFAGDASYGMLIVKDIPGFSEARRAAFNDTIRTARDPPPHCRRPRSTWPGMRSDRHVGVAQAYRTETTSTSTPSTAHRR